MLFHKGICFFFRFDGYDYKGTDLIPEKNYNKNIAFFFVIFFAIANLVLNNILAGILVERFFNFEKQKS